MKKSEFYKDGFDEKLLVINNIRFTPREIDLLACLLKAHSTKKISSLLSIYPKTVRNHLHNIMTKLGCNSRDSIIEFVEKSEKLSLLKEHYATLALKASFEQSLKEISKTTRGRGVYCNLIYWTETTFNDSLVRNIQAHLNLVGIISSLELRNNKPILSDLLNEPQKDSYRIYILPKALIETSKTSAFLKNKNLSQLSQNNYSSHSLFLTFEKTHDAELFGKELTLSFLDWSREENYFFAFFNLLSKLFPNLSADKIVTEFKDKYNNKSEHTEQTIPQVVLREKKVESFSFHQQWVYYFSASVLVALIGTGFLVYSWNQKSQDAATLRSGLIIPVDLALLNRPELLAQMDRAFNGNEGIQTVALVGIGGSGKTTLARQFAQQQKTNIVWEINGETDGNLHLSFEKLAHTFAKTEKEKKILRDLLETHNSSEKKEKLINFVKEHLKQHSPWFLIFDNVENFSDIQQYFPQDSKIWGAGKIILTTRNINIQNNPLISHVITTGELTQEQKQELFTKIMNDEKSHVKAGEEISVFLEHIPPFPLDVSVAAYYLKSTNISYVQYVEKLKHYRKETDELQTNMLKETGEYTRTRYAIITHSLDHLIKNHKDFADLLLFISLLDSQNIPKSLLDQYKGSNFVDNFIYQLKKHSLITAQVLPSLSEPMYAMHRSTQSMSLAYLIDYLKVHQEHPQLRRIVFTLDDYADQAIEQEDFARMRSLSPHLERTLGSDLLTDFSKGLLESKLGSIYYFISSEKSKQVLEDSLNILERKSLEHLSSEDKLKLARSLLHIGAVYTERRLDKKAKEVLEKAVDIYKKEGQKNNSDLAWALSYLGNIHRKLGNYDKARDCLEKSISLCKQYGDNNKRIARALAYLGSVYRGLGFFQKAIETLEESLSIYQINDLNDNFRIGWIQLQLGNVNRDLGNFQKAKEQLENGLRIFQKHLPDNHVSIGVAFAYLGNCYRELGDYEKSRYYLEQSLIIHKKHFNDQHVKMGWLLLHLANTYKALGYHQEAQQLLDKALKIYTAYDGEDNIEKARLLRSVAKIYLEKNLLHEAENYIIKSLGIFQSHNHVEVFRALKILGEILLKKSACLQDSAFKQDLRNQAMKRFNEALKITQRSFPKGSVNIQKIEDRMKEIKNENTAGVN